MNTKSETKLQTLKGLAGGGGSGVPQMHKMSKIAFKRFIDNQNTRMKTLHDVQPHDFTTRTTMCDLTTSKEKSHNDIGSFRSLIDL